MVTLGQLSLHTFLHTPTERLCSLNDYVWWVGGQGSDGNVVERLRSEMATMESQHYAKDKQVAQLEHEVWCCCTATAAITTTTTTINSA